MKLHPPPGRSGRLWLEHRLAVAGRADDLLRQKRQALSIEERRLRVLLRETERRWQDAAAAAEQWVTRAMLLAAADQLGLLASQVRGTATADLQWRSSMGVEYPADAQALLPEAPPTFPLAGSAATDVALPEVRQAVTAAVSHAAARTAIARVSRELETTKRRVRAIERRWIPALQVGLHDLRLRLEELEREDGVRARWVRRRIERRGGLA